MAILDSDSLLLSQKQLSGIHEDAVRCVYDERLNRLKRLCHDPDDQLSEFKKVTDEAHAFWCAVSKLPEDRGGRLSKVQDKLSRFFDRVIRYTDFHANERLSEGHLTLKREVIRNARDKKKALNN